MTHPDDRGNVWLRIGALYDGVAAHRRERAVRAPIFLPALTAGPAFVTPHIKRRQLVLFDFSPPTRVEGDS